MKKNRVLVLGLGVVLSMICTATRGGADEEGDQQSPQNTASQSSVLDQSECASFQSNTEYKIRMYEQEVLYFLVLKFDKLNQAFYLSESSKTVSTNYTYLLDYKNKIILKYDGRGREKLRLLCSSENKECSEELSENKILGIIQHAISSNGAIYKFHDKNGNSDLDPTRARSALQCADLFVVSFKK